MSLSLLFFYVVLLLIVEKVFAKDLSSSSGGTVWCIDVDSVCTQREVDSGSFYTTILDIPRFQFLSYAGTERKQLER